MGDRAGRAPTAATKSKASGSSSSHSAVSGASVEALTAHLSSQGFPAAVTDALARECVDGRMFLTFLESAAEYDEVFGDGLTRAQKLWLCKHRRTLLAQAETLDSGKDGGCGGGDEPPGGHVEKRERLHGEEKAREILERLNRGGQKWQEPRPFLHTEHQAVYVKCPAFPLPLETGSNPAEPCREFKAFGVDISDRARAERALADRAAPFAVGCLNARCRGTLYLGVGDNRKASRRLVHGQVVGVRLAADDRDFLQTALERSLTGGAPLLLKGGVPSMSAEMRDAVRGCVMPLRFVSVVSPEGERDLFVVEMDVIPTVDWCGDLIFFLPGRAKANPKEVDLSQDPVEVNTYYFREGTSTQSYKRREDMPRLREQVERASARLKAEERSALLSRDTPTEEKLVGLLSRGRSSGMASAVKDLSYVLVLNDLDGADVEQAKWLTSLNFVTVIDVGRGNDRMETPFYKLYTDEIIKEPVLLKGDDLYDTLQVREVEHFLSDVEAGEKTLYLSCSPGPGVDHSSWLQKGGRGLSKLVSHWFDRSHMKGFERLVVIFLLRDAGKQQEMAFVARAFFNTDLSCDQYICLTPNDSNFEVFLRPGNEQFGIMEWRQQQISCDLSLLSSVMLQKTKVDKAVNFRLPSSGVSVEIANDILEFYQKSGITIWPMGQNDYINDMDPGERTEFNEVCRDKVREFLRGRGPEWQVFHASEPTTAAGVIDVQRGLVERDHLRQIKMRLGDLRREKKAVVSMVVKHRPGAGATTVGRHILWQEREDKRAVSVDASQFTIGSEVDLVKLEKVADKLMLIRKLGEDAKSPAREVERKWKPVLILFDNASENLAKKLEWFLLTKCTDASVSQNGAFILLVLVSTFETDAASSPVTKNISNVPRSGGKLPLLIEQQLSTREQGLFGDTLKNFVRDSDTCPDDIISFVIIAENFNEESEYIRNVVKNTLSGLRSLYPQQARLLLYLSVLKYHANIGLPESHCEKHCFPLLRHSWFHRTTYSPQFLSFVECRQHTDSFIHDCVFMEVTHVPVAAQVFKQLALQETTSAVVRDMLSNNVLMGETFLKTVVHNNFRILLTKRGASQKQGRNKFANVIMKIQSSESQEAAQDILEYGFEKIEGENNKAFIGQAQARFFSEVGNFKKAKEWAERAKEQVKTNFAVADTAGQVHRKELRHLKDALFKNAGGGPHPLKSCEDILTAAKQATDNFKLGQSLFKDEVRKLRQLEGGGGGGDKGRRRTVDTEGSSSMPGVIGLIDCNLMALAVLLRCRELDRQEVRAEALRILQRESAADLTGVLPQAVPWSNKPWSELHEFLMGLCAETKRFVGVAYTRLTYMKETDDDHGIWHDLGKFVDELNALLGTSLSGVSAVLQRRASPARKLAEMRRVLRLGVTHTFGRLMAKSLRLAEVNTYAAVAGQLLALAEAAGEPLTNEDKLSFVNLSLAFAYHRDGDCSNFPLDSAVVRQFCRQLVQADYDSPEPYFAFMTLFWPDSQMEEGSTEDNAGASLAALPESDMALLSKSLERLGEFKYEFSDLTMRAAVLLFSKPRPIFVLGRRRGAHMLNRFLSTKNSPTYRRHDLNALLAGRTDRDGDVVVRIGTEELRVRSARLNYRNVFGGGGRRVRFNLGFSFNGPVAYNLDEETGEDQERRKIEARMMTIPGSRGR